MMRQNEYLWSKWLNEGSKDHGYIEWRSAIYNMHVISLRPGGSVVSVLDSWPGVL